MSETLIKAYQAHRSHTELGDRISKGYINALVGETLETLKLIPNQNEGGDVIARILAYCSKNFKNNISIESLSRAVGISPKYCSSVISSHLGQNFREYINTLRMFEVTRMLKNTEYPITYIALEVGYKNQSTFNRVFLERYGVTPGEYRKNKQNNEKTNKTLNS